LIAQLVDSILAGSFDLAQRQIRQRIRGWLVLRRGTYQADVILVVIVFEEIEPGLYELIATVANDPLPGLGIGDASRLLKSGEDPSEVNERIENAKGKSHVRSPRRERRCGRAPPPSLRRRRTIHVGRRGLIK
jgi:hypothetical protein